MSFLFRFRLVNDPEPFPDSSRNPPALSLQRAIEEVTDSIQYSHRTSLARTWLRDNVAWIEPEGEA